MFQTVLMWLMLTAMPLAASFDRLLADATEAQEQQQLQQEQQTAVIDATKLIKLGGLVSQIGATTSRLGVLLEKGEIDQVQSTLDELDSDVLTFSSDLKLLVHEEYHSQIDQTAHLVRDNIDEMKANATQENIDKAREEYQRMLANWDSLGEYYQDRAEGALQDKEQVKGWLNWSLDWFYNWWQSE